MKAIVATTALYIFLYCGPLFLSGCKAEDPPKPLSYGKCTNIAMEYHGNNRWLGETRCQYEGYWWTCATNTPESARICKRAEPVPGEKPPLL